MPSTDSAPSLPAANAVPSEGFSSPRFHAHFTLTYILKIAKWKISKRGRSATEALIYSKTNAQFCEYFRTNPNANFMRAKCPWESRSKSINNAPGSVQRMKSSFFFLRNITDWETTSSSKGAHKLAAKMCQMGHSA